MDERLEPLWSNISFKKIWEDLERECVSIASSIHRLDKMSPLLDEHTYIDIKQRMTDGKSVLLRARDPDHSHVEIRTSLENIIQQLLGRPSIVTADDVLDCAHEHLMVPHLSRLRLGAGSNSAQVEDVVRRSAALQLAKTSLAQRCQRHFNGRRTRLVRGAFASAFDVPVSYPLGESRLSLAVVSAGIPHAEPFMGRPTEVRRADPWRDVFGYVSGQCSTRSMIATHADATAMLRCALKSLHVLPPDPIADGAPRAKIRNAKARRYAAIDHKVVLLKCCIDCYFSGRRRSVFESRVRNALQLLVQADSQTHDVVAVTLSVAAIEALLVDSKELISEKLATRTATLLEPMAQDRPDAKRKLKRMYTLRSELVHGAEYDPSRIRSRRVRELASAVLVASLLLSIEVSRTERPETAFFAALDAAQESGIAVPGGPSNAGLSRYVRDLEASYVGP